jgi:hypothetical protein
MLKQVLPFSSNDVFAVSHSSFVSRHNIVQDACPEMIRHHPLPSKDLAFPKKKQLA